MKWLRLLILGLVASGGSAGLWQYQRRRRLPRILPVDLILQPELEYDQVDGYRRTIPLKGVVNFRDIGGYQTVDGRRVKWGLIYRSAMLDDITPEDLVTLQSLNLKTICDLRYAAEITSEPDPIPGVAYLHMPIIPGDRARQTLETMIFRPHRLGSLMQETYTHRILDNNGKLYGDLLRQFADPDNLPLVLHCTAGKDRTGIGIMLLLVVLGVPEDTILADYSLTNRYYDTIAGYVTPMVRRLRWVGVQIEDLQTLLVADPAIMQYALDYLRTRYGSVQQYLKVNAGLDDTLIDQLKANLLE